MTSLDHNVLPFWRMKPRQIAISSSFSSETLGGFETYLATSLYVSMAIRSAVFLFLLAFSSANAAENDLHLKWNDVYTLNIFEGVQLQHHYFGEYRFVYEFTGGTKLHLFPNKHFVISEWLDIAPEQFLASGTFTVSGDKLALTFSKVRPSFKGMQKQYRKLHVLWGDIDKGDYITGFEAFILSDEEFKKVKEGSNDVRFMVRGTQYNDWERIWRSYEKAATE